MLFMVIEHFKGGDPECVRERFERAGRMQPAGVEYIASWIDAANGRCFQVMEAPDRAALDPWMEKWADLMEFEVSAVVGSKEYWAGVSARET